MPNLPLLAEAWVSFASNHWMGIIVMWLVFCAAISSIND